jgi:hypothetical protein
MSLRSCSCLGDIREHWPTPQTITFQPVSQFKDPELGVTTSTRVRDGLPVLLVFHERDGEWQFLSGAEESPDEA